MNNTHRLLAILALLSLAANAPAGKNHDIDQTSAAIVDSHDDHGDHEEEGGHQDHDDHAEVDTHDHAEVDTHQDHDDHDSHAGHDDHGDEEGLVELSAEQQRLAGIEVVPLQAQLLNRRLYAPGELQRNAYSTYRVSPRVPSVIVKRHVILGEEVEAGKLLLTLFSETVAEAQTDYRVQVAEWRRVQKLGRKSVGARRYVEAENNWRLARSRLLAYGLDKTALTQLERSPSVSLGEYALRATMNGTVLADDFAQGQQVEAGETLLELADERQLWVAARLAPTELLDLPKGSQARVQVAGRAYWAEVFQETHTIDPTTRTRVVRLLLDNPQHRLHPGMFVDVYFTLASKAAVLAVQESALMRDEHGDWTVFVEEKPGHFKAVEVELGQRYGRWREVKNIPAGTPVVTRGAFFVASQIAKGGFDPHNH